MGVGRQRAISHNVAVGLSHNKSHHSNSEIKNEDSSDNSPRSKSANPQTETDAFASFLKYNVTEEEKRVEKRNSSMFKQIDEESSEE